MNLEKLLAELRGPVEARTVAPDRVIEVPSAVGPAQGYRASTADELVARSRASYLDHLLPGVPAYALEPTPAIALVEAPDDQVRAMHPDVHRTSKGWVLDAREAPRAVLLESEAGTVLVQHDGRRLEIFTVDASAPDSPSALDALIGWSPDEEPTSPNLPFVADVLRGAPCAAWLADATSNLEASGVLLDRVAALGAVGRFWLPPEQDLLAWMHKPISETPSGRAWAACASLSGHLADVASRQAVAACALLLDDLHAIVEAHESGHVDTVLAFTCALAIAFDDLVSVRAALARSGQDVSLVAALRHLEREALQLADFLPPAGSLRHVGRLTEAARATPDAWWGALAR